MKRLISVLVIATMLFASIMAMIPASADDVVGGDAVIDGGNGGDAVIEGGEPIPVPEPEPVVPFEDPKADAATATYNVNWKALHEANKMQANWKNEPRGLGANSEFVELFTVTATENSIVAGLNPNYDTTKWTDGYEQRTYFSTDMVTLTDTTYFEYVFSGKNNRATGYSGFVFAYDTNNYPYFIYGAIDNKSDTNGKSEFRIQKGVHGTYVSGTDTTFIVLDVDSDGYGTAKIVFDGYDVTVYGLTDAANGTYTLIENASFTLPEGSKIAPGIFCRDSGSGNQRTPSLKGGVITAWNKESAAIMNGDTARAALITAIYAAQELVASDYTEDTAAAFTEALEAAKAVVVDDTKLEADLAAAQAALEDAQAKLVAEEADFYNLKMVYTQVKYMDSSDIVDQRALSAWMATAEAAFEDEDILNSEVDAILDALDDIPKLKPIFTAEEFMNMDSNGSYILMNSISLNESYGEFKGYLDGNGNAITVADKGIFGTLNGAAVIDLTMMGSITASTNVGALATDAKGDVTVTNVTNNVSITVNSSGKNVAGFIAQGKGANITFTGCVNNADIIGGRTAGFYANSNSGTNNLYFYNCVNAGDISCGESVSTNPAAGFVARTADGTTKDIVFKYCTELGNINSKYSAGAFFGCGKGNIVMYGCVVGGMGAVTVTAHNNQSHMRPIGGVIGGATSGDTPFSVDINACYFTVSVEVTQNYSGNPVALIVGGAASGKVSIKNVYAEGQIIALDNNAYRITSVPADRLTLDKVFFDVDLMTRVEGEPVENPNAVDTTPNTDVEAFDEASAEAASEGAIAFVIAATMGMDAEDKAETTELFIEALGMFKTTEEVELEEMKASAKEFVEGALKAADAYTEESYAAYLADVNKLLADVEAAADADALEALDGEKVIAAAEAKLVTLEAAKTAADAKALADAKAVALIALSAKRENAGNVFTEASYKEYSTAFDALKAQIEGAADLAALNAIDIAALKVAAENKLAVEVPKAPEADADDKDAADDDDKDDDKKDDETDAPDAEGGCGGCGSSAALSAIAIVGVIGTALALKKKED